MRRIRGQTTRRAERDRAPWRIAVALTLVALLMTGCGLIPGATSTGGVTTSSPGGVVISAGGVPLLPGEQMWGDWPSYLFGTNDTQNWDGQHNFETLPDLQQRLKADHFPFIRVWFFQRSLATHKLVSDEIQLIRAQTALNAGMTCMGELATKNSMAYDEHLVALLKGKCRFYEFMNEPDLEGVHAADYIQAWRTEIPKLRAIDPSAKFGGPADYTAQGAECTYNADGSSQCFMQKVLQGMASSGVLPDFVTFHWYPCFQISEAKCAPKAVDAAKVTKSVRGWVAQYFHRPIPVGITEWNVDPSAPMPQFTQDAAWMTQFTTTALTSMQSAGLSFANQFDLANYGGYGSDDMVDISHDGAPKPQYLAMKALIDQARAGGITTPAAGG